MRVLFHICFLNFCVVKLTSGLCEFIMTTNIQQGSLLDVLKKKMRQTKEEMERYKDECEEFNKRLQVEIIRREEVSCFYDNFNIFYLFCVWG